MITQQNNNKLLFDIFFIAAIIMMNFMVENISLFIQLNEELCALSK